MKAIFNICHNRAARLVALSMVFAAAVGAVSFGTDAALPGSSDIQTAEANYELTTLVSNLNRPPCPHGDPPCEFNPQNGYVISSTRERAVQFTTGRSGAQLDQVRINLQGRRPWKGDVPEPANPTAPALSLWTQKVIIHDPNSPNARITVPGELLAELSTPGSPEVGDNTYGLSSPHQLDANTTYWLIFSCDTYCPWPVARTTSNREDPGMSGWSIADDGRSRHRDSSVWGATSAVIRVSLDWHDYQPPQPEFRSGYTSFQDHWPKNDFRTDSEANGGRSFIGIQFDQELDPDSVPAPGDFAITYSGPRPPASCDCNDQIYGLEIESVAIGNISSKKNRYLKLYLNRPTLVFARHHFTYTPGEKPLRSKGHHINVESFTERVGYKTSNYGVQVEHGRYDLSEGEGQLTFDIVGESDSWPDGGKPGVSADAIHVAVFYDDDTAMSGHDYHPRQYRATIPAFGNRATVTVPIDDDLVELKSESFLVGLTHPPAPVNDHLMNDSVRIGTRTKVFIEDDDETNLVMPGARPVTVDGTVRNVASFRVTEGESVQIPIGFSPKLLEYGTFVRLRPSSVGTTTASGADWDLQQIGQTGDKGGVQFEPRERTRTVPFFALADDVDEGDETVWLEFDYLSFSVHTDPMHYAKITIVNREAPTEAPSNFAATAHPDRVELAWDAVTDAERYHVLRKVQGDTDYTRVGSVNGTSYTDRRVQVNTTYVYVVRAINSDNVASADSSELTVTVLPPLPPAPTGFKATVEEGPQVALNWNAVSDRYLTGYRVSRGGTELALLDTGTRKYTDTGVSVGTTYEYTVAGVNSAGDGPSATVSIEVTAIVDGVRTPGNLRAEAASDGITLHWDGVDNAMRYRVHRKGPGDTAHKDFMSTSVTTFRDSRVTAGETYSYKVQAQDWDFNKGALSDAVQATVPHPLHPPRNFTAELDASDSKTVNLSWDAPTSGGNTLTGYKLFRAKYLNENKLIATLGASATSYQDTGTSWDRSHDYNLIATYSGNKESESARVNIRTPSQPP